MAGEYAALLPFAVLGGIGVPGPGDGGLIAAALLAAEDHLSLAVVLVVAYIGCLIGRMIGYQVGAKGGRAVMKRPGWFSGLRSATLTKGDRVFQRFPRTAVLIAPAPIAGIYAVPPPIFALASLLVGLSWVLSTGLIAYFLGEAALEVVGRAGFKGFHVVVVLVGLGLVLRYLRHHRGAPAGATTSLKR
jgi:membrane-associated protein